MDGGGGAPQITCQILAVWYGDVFFFRSSADELSVGGAPPVVCPVVVTVAGRADRALFLLFIPPKKKKQKCETRRFPCTATKTYHTPSVYKSACKSFSELDVA